MRILKANDNQAHSSGSSDGAQCPGLSPRAKRRSRSEAARAPFFSAASDSGSLSSGSIDGEGALSGVAAAPDDVLLPGAAKNESLRRARGAGRKGEVRALELDEVFSPAPRKPVPLTNVVAQSPRLKKMLRATLLFREVPVDDFERFYDLLRWRRVPSGAQLLAGGERSPWVFLLVEGTAKVHQKSASGAQVIFSICGAGEILGEMSAIDGEAHSATVTMLEPSLLGAVDREEFLAFLLCVPQMSLNLAAITSRRLRAATARIQSLSRLDVTGRLAAQLLLFASHYGQSPPNSPKLMLERFNPERAALERVDAEHVPLNLLEAQGSGVAIALHLRQSDLADLIGASRVRVNQVLHQLRRSGHITVQGNHISLLDINALRARCE